MPYTKDEAGSPFRRIYVDYAVKDTARITWELRYDFPEPEPHRFQLQVNRNYNETGDWEDVGTIAVNSTYAVDDTQRQFGKSLRVGYRVVLTTPIDTHTSPVAQVLGKLSLRQWLLARAMLRRIIKKATGHETMPGYLMKRKLHGSNCTCLDPMTGAITNSDCATCLGTGKIVGYYQATDNTLFDIGPHTEETKRSELGTINQEIMTGTMIGIPLPVRNDVWVDANSDRRYFIQRVTPTSELNHVPLVVQVELRLAELTDVVYDVSI